MKKIINLDGKQNRSTDFGVLALGIVHAEQIFTAQWCLRRATEMSKGQRGLPWEGGLYKENSIVQARKGYKHANMKNMSHNNPNFLIQEVQIFKTMTSIQLKIH